MPKAAPVLPGSASLLAGPAADFAVRYLGLPLEAKAERLAPIDWEAGHPIEGAQSIAVLSSHGNPFLWIFVAESRPLREVAAEIEPLLRAQTVVTTAVVTTGDPDDTVVLRWKPAHEHLQRQTGISSVTLRRPDASLQPFVRPRPGAPRGRVQVALGERVERLLFELHSDLRDIDGLHPDAALDELCKVLLVKTFDEAATLPGTAPRLQRLACLSDDDLAATARSLYTEAVSSSLGGLFGDVGALRGAFASPIMASNAALSKVLTQLEPFSLSDSDVDIKARAFQQVLSPAMRAGMGQFFTPLPVIRFMVKVVQPTRDERVLDPFAGSGRFLAETRSLLSRGDTGSGVAHEQRASFLHAIEKSDRMIRVALTDMVLHGGLHATYHFGDSLSPFASLSGLAPDTFDVVLTNPPFGSLLKNGAISRLGPFTVCAGRQSVPLEVLGLERSIQFLRPGGRIGIVIPDGLLANPGSQYVREWLARGVVTRAIVSLPVETFSPFGANVKTSVIFARRRLPGERPPDDLKVFVGAVSNVGYDAAGRDTGDSELDAMATACAQFLKEEGW
ncbi:MAG: SAM-dependent DNA methyltransferase [Phycisphaerales bacterium]|nr:SAM-dependent DNA methyltransferase [Phycisphaerales bacterium]